MKKKVIPIFYACDDNFVKYTVISALSLVENASKNYDYIIYILNTGISQHLIESAKQIERENVTVEFVNVTSYLDSIKDELPIRDYYSKTTYYRLFIAEMYKEYDKAIYIDSDTIVLGDISEFYNNDLQDNYVGACNEQAIVQNDIYGRYVEEVDGISRHSFFNAGLLLINCNQWRKKKVLKQFVDLLQVYNFVVIQDEDYLNVICKDRVCWIDNSWNTEVYGEIKYKDEEINMIHYIMWGKPWHFEDVRYGNYFWDYCKKTTFYEEVLEIAKNFSPEAKQKAILGSQKLEELAISEINREDNYLKIQNQKKKQDRLDVLSRIEEYELTGRFYEDVEIDPPGKVINPGTVDYLRKKIRSKIKTKYAYHIARKFLNNIIDDKKMIVKKILGAENLENLESGAIITCNHFNAFDSFAIQMAYEACVKNRRKRKLYRVIREGNYTSFPGFYGFLMRNCYTLPISSNRKALEEMMKSVDILLKKGNLVLVYPEQSMWWNYRKPKPLKRGAYHFAVKSNVPVVPCFITMKDSEIIDENGFNVQEYTIHIEKPIYPDPSKSNSQNIDYLLEKNYEVWKEIYEKTYKMPLVYKTNKAVKAQM